MHRLNFVWHILFSSFGLSLVRTKMVIKLFDWEHVEWDGCLYSRNLPPMKETDLCYLCTDRGLNRIKIEDSAFRWNQEYFNCSHVCEYNTICTYQQYYLESPKNPTRSPQLRNFCYQCANRKTEDIEFEYAKLCENQECHHCALSKDLSQANKCVKVCDGYPTFCTYGLLAPGEELLIHPAPEQSICFQSRRRYGCDFKEVNKEILPDRCIICSLKAEDEDDAEQCSHVCDGTPTYSAKNGSIFLQCEDHADVRNFGDLFLFNIPNKIISYLGIKFEMRADTKHPEDTPLSNFLEPRPIDLRLKTPTLDKWRINIYSRYQ